MHLHLMYLPDTHLYHLILHTYRIVKMPSISSGVIESKHLLQIHHAVIPFANGIVICRFSTILIYLQLQVFVSRLLIAICLIFFSLEVSRYLHNQPCLFQQSLCIQTSICNHHFVICLVFVSSLILHCAVYI